MLLDMGGLPHREWYDHRQALPDMLHHSAALGQALLFHKVRVPVRAGVVLRGEQDLGKCLARSSSSKQASAIRTNQTKTFFFFSVDNMYSIKNQ